MGMLFNRKTMIEEEINDLRAEVRRETTSLEKESVLANRRYYVQKHNRHEHLMNLKNKLDQLKNEVEQQQDQLSEALMRMRMMEKLKERDKEDFIDRIEHAEQLQQNEVAIQQFNSGYRHGH